MIEVKKLFSGYGDKQVITGADMLLESGKLCVILGPNGCGKSTLIKTILGIVKKTSGDIILDGKPLDEIKPNERAKLISYLPQNTDAGSTTVFRYVLCARYPYSGFPTRYSKEDERIAKAALEKFRISELWDTPLDRISGGQRQKAALAFAYAQNAKNLLLDEPAAFLDISAQFELMGLLKSMAKEGRTICATLHDIPMALEFADKVLVMNGGGIAFCGTPDEAVKSRQIEKTFNVTVKKIEEHYICVPK